MKKIRLLFLTLVALMGGLVSSHAAYITVYVDPVGDETWLGDNAKISVNVYTDGQSNNTFVTPTTYEGDVLKVTFADTYNRMIIVRGENQNAWGWNQTENITPVDNTLYKANGYNGDQLAYTTVNPYVVAPAAGYTVDFNTAISTSAHDFAVASNWSHLVGTGNYDGYGPYYMSYSYYASSGVDGTGCLSAGRQYAGDNWGGTECTDLLITPEVKGTITLDVKKTSSSNSFIEFYNVTGSEGAWVQGEQITFTGDELSQTAFVTVTLNVTDYSRIGIRGSNVYMDNFTAEEANIIPEKKITIASAVATDGNSGTTGTIKWNQQANGKVLVKYTVTVTNNGEVDLTQGMDGYSISIINDKTGDVVATIPVPQDLAVGETSDPFDVQAEVETSLWPNTYTYIKFNLRENLKNSVLQRAQSGYNAYESKFVFREAGSTSTSSLSSAQNWGTITESTSKNFEVANLGTAPLTITAYTGPVGFTLTPGFNPMSMPEGVSISGTSLVMQGGAVVPFTVTQDASTIGTYSGILNIVYQDYGVENTTDYTLDFSATVIGVNTWTADFNNTTTTAVYPQGSVKEGGIQTDWDNKTSDGKYNIYLKGYNTASYATENNKFITPKLHAATGDKLAFDVKAGNSSSDEYFVKVYVSTDRQNWGEPVETYVYSNVGSSFVTKTISFDAEGDYYVAFALYGTGSGIDNLVGLEKVAVAHDLYIKSVKWPDASIKSGSAQTKPSVDIIPLTDEVAANYTVKYIYGENVVEIASTDLTTSASSTTTFAASFTPEVTTTTTFSGTKVVFEFTDGTKFETETFDLTVTNEPIFHFLSSKYTSRWYEPSSDYTTPVNFGKTNTSGASKTFYVLNWGSAPLTVKSIAVPNGFTASAESMNIPAFDGTQDGLETCQQALDITFSATEAGTYSGNMVITYVDGAGEDATFELALSGTMLDPTKWYANFGGESNQWPAGSVYQDNVSTTYVNTGDYAITSSSTTKNMFVTPKLTAVAGDKLLFDAKLYDNTSWSEGKVVVYAAATRGGVLNATTRTQLFSVSGQDETNPMTTDYQTFEVSVPAGNWYLGFEISGRPYVDEIYGLKQFAVEHDWVITSSNIPTEAMQNYASTATVNILNLGLQDEAAEDITVTAYVNDVAVATAEGVAIPMSHKLSDAGTQLSVNFMSTVAGTFPVYVEVKAGDYSIATETVNVVFAEEEAKSDAVAEADGVSSYVPLNLTYYNSESVSLYTASVLEGSYGLASGAKIKSITYKGYKTGYEHSSTLNVWYEWVDETAQSQPANGLYNTEDMTQIVTDQTQTWETKGSESELEDFITLNFSEPLVYQGKALRIVVRSTSDAWRGVSFEKGTSATSELAYYHYDDTYSTFASNSWKSSVLPVLHMALEASVATLTGTVKTSGREAIANATVTLKAANGVEYSGTTNAEGAYSINVIQAGLDFTATVEAENYLKKEFAYNLGGESKTLDVTLYQSYGIVGGFPGFDWDNDKPMTQSTEDPNIFTLVVEGVQLEAKKYEYKLRADGIWQNSATNDGYELPSSGNNNWEFKLAGTYTLKFTANVSEHTLTLEPVFVLEQNTANIAAANLGGVTIASERQIKAGWNAIYLPVYVSAEEVTALFGANAEIAYYAGDESDASGNITVNFGKRGEGSIEAGVPYLLWSENELNGFELTGREIKADQWPTTGTTFDFVGTYSFITAKAGDYFIAGGEFKKATENNTVKPFRSYLKLKEGQTARSLKFVIGDQTTTQMIEGLVIEDQKNVEGVYNMQGQKVQNMNRKGLYIINGKKVMVK